MPQRAESKKEANRPQDNSAAKQAPRETKTAVANTFGKIPQEAHAKQSGEAAPAPKTFPITAVPADPKLALIKGDDAKTIPPVAPEVQSILDAGLPEGKTVKEKLEASAPAYMLKAAQDHYNKQKENGEQLDSISKFYLNVTARYMAENGVKEDDIPPEKLTEVFDIGKINQNLDDITKSSDFIRWVGEQHANAIENTIANTPDIAKLVEPYKKEGDNFVNALRALQSDYVAGQAFADAVGTAQTKEEGKKLVEAGITMLSSLGMGEKETLGVDNTLSENVRRKYTPDAPKRVIDPNTNKPVQTDDGTDLATLPDGTYVSMGKDGKPVADKQGGMWVYNQDGTAKFDAGNAHVQYEVKAQTTYASYGGIKYMVGPDGKGKLAAQGRRLAIDSDGGDGGDGKYAHDGKYQVVLDKQGNLLQTTPEGKTVVEEKTGLPFLFDPGTKSTAVNPATGRWIMLDTSGAAVEYNADDNAGMPVAVDADGSRIKNPDTGNTAVYNIDGEPAVIAKTGGRIEITPHALPENFIAVAH